jgi:hypothetical protein
MQGYLLLMILRADIKNWRARTAATPSTYFAKSARTFTGQDRRDQSAALPPVYDLCSQSDAPWCQRRARPQPYPIP